MDRRDANIMLSAILETIHAAGQEGAPLGPMYAALMSRVNLDEFQRLIQLLTKGGLITSMGHVARLTDRGQETVRKIKELMG